MPEISKITLPGGGTYDLKDAAARDAIASLSGGSYFLGVTTTAITDQSTTNPITINGSSVYAINGNMTIYGNKEFVWSCTSYNYYTKDSAPVSGGTYKYWYNIISNPTAEQKQAAVFTPTPIADIPTTSSSTLTTPLANGADIIKAQYSGKWVEFGDTSNLGQLAYKDAISYTKDIKSVVSGVSTSKLDTQTVSVVGAISGVTTSKLSTVSCDVVSGVLSGVSANTTKLVKTTVPNVTSAGSASTWSFTMGSGANAETLVISGANGTAATLGTAIDVATGSVGISGTGATVATGVIGSTYQGGVLGAPSGASSTVTLATGSVASNAGGATVATGSSGGGYVLEAPSGQSSGDVTFAKGTVSGSGSGATVATGASGTVNVVGSASDVEAV